MVLTSSSSFNYVPNEHEDFDHYDPYTILSKIMSCYSYPATLGSQNEIRVAYLVNKLIYH